MTIPGDNVWCVGDNVCCSGAGAALVLVLRGSITGDSPTPLAAAFISHS